MKRMTKTNLFADTQCMAYYVYLPISTINLSQMEENMPYIECLGLLMEKSSVENALPLAIVVKKIAACEQTNRVHSLYTATAVSAILQRITFPFPDTSVIGNSFDRPYMSSIWKDNGKYMQHVSTLHVCTYACLSEICLHPEFGALKHLHTKNTRVSMQHKGNMASSCNNKLYTLWYLGDPLGTSL